MSKPDLARNDGKYRGRRRTRWLAHVAPCYAHTQTCQRYGLPYSSRPFTYQRPSWPSSCHVPSSSQRSSDPESPCARPDPVLHLRGRHCLHDCLLRRCSVHRPSWSQLPRASASSMSSRPCSLLHRHAHLCLLRGKIGTRRKALRKRGERQRSRR